jgi:hypothetical protein
MDQLATGQHGQQTRVIGRGLYVERLTVGTHQVHGRMHATAFLLHENKIIPPPESWDPPPISSHGRKCLLIPAPDTSDPPATASHAEVPPYYGEKNDSAPDSWDPPAISSHARKCLFVLPDSWGPPGRSVRSVICLVANVYVHSGQPVSLQQ